MLNRVNPDHKFPWWLCNWCTRATYVKSITRVSTCTGSDRYVTLIVFDRFGVLSESSLLYQVFRKVFYRFRNPLFSLVIYSLLTWKCYFNRGSQNFSNNQTFIFNSRDLFWINRTSRATVRYTNREKVITKRSMTREKRRNIQLPRRLKPSSWHRLTRPLMHVIAKRFVSCRATAKTVTFVTVPYMRDANRLVIDDKFSLRMRRKWRREMIRVSLVSTSFTF